MVHDYRLRGRTGGGSYASLSAVFVHLRSTVHPRRRPDHAAPDRQDRPLQRVDQWMGPMDQREVSLGLYRRVFLDFQDREDQARVRDGLGTEPVPQLLAGQSADLPDGLHQHPLGRRPEQSRLPPRRSDPVHIGDVAPVGRQAHPDDRDGCRHGTRDSRPRCAHRQRHPPERPLKLRHLVRPRNRLPLQLHRHAQRCLAFRDLLGHKRGSYRQTRRRSLSRDHTRSAVQTEELDHDPARSPVRLVTIPSRVFERHPKISIHPGFRYPLSLLTSRRESWRKDETIARLPGNLGSNPSAAALKFERNAVGAGLVARAEHWRWSGLWARMHGEDAIKAILSPWPVERPVDWTDRVNAPLSAKEFGRVRVSIERGRPHGEDEWVKRTASELRLEHTIRPEGRPPKPRN